MGSSVTQFLSGAIVAGDLVAALLFARSWRDTRDRLFAAFAVAFAVLAFQRMALAFLEGGEHAVLLYSVRLAAFAIILWAIVDKNRTRRGEPQR
jgi:hypothetical protein